jgi:hypothetical protein
VMLYYDWILAFWGLRRHAYIGEHFTFDKEVTSEPASNEPRELYRICDSAQAPRA